MASDVDHTCAIATDDAIARWGNNRNSQTGAPAGTYKALTSEVEHGCAIAIDDTVVCWPSLPKEVRWVSTNLPGETATSRSADVSDKLPVLRR